MHVHVLFRLNATKQNKHGLCPVEIRLTYQKQRRQLASGHFLSTVDWKKLQEGTRTRSAAIQQVKEFMETFRAKLHRLTTTLELENRMDLETLIDLYVGKQTAASVSLLQLFQQHREELEKRLAIDRSRATLNKYRYTEDKVRSFLSFHSQKKDIAISKLEPSFIQLFYDYLLLECKIHHNTIAKYCKNLKRILNYGKEKGLLKDNPFDMFRIGYKDISRAYLTASELAVLERKLLPVPRLQVVKDLFLFQCYTGLSFVDLSRLQKEHLVEGIDHKEWLVIYRQKTNGKSVIPLLGPALAIIKRYVGSPSVKEGRLLPDISNQKLNAYLKEIGELCGLQKTLTSHMGRRTFATTVALSNGVSLESIAKVLGHASTKMTSLYAVVTDLKLSEEMAALQAKLQHRTGDQT